MDDQVVPLVLLAMASLGFLVTLMCLALVVIYGRLWLQASLAGFPLPLVRVMTIRLRNAPPALIVQAYLTLRRKGEQIQLEDLEHFYLDSGGQIDTSFELVHRFQQSGEPPASSAP